VSEVIFNGQHYFGQRTSLYYEQHNYILKVGVYTFVLNTGKSWNLRI